MPEPMPILTPKLTVVKACMLLFEIYLWGKFALVRRASSRDRKRSQRLGSSTSIASGASSKATQMYLNSLQRNLGSQRACCHSGRPPRTIPTWRATGGRIGFDQLGSARAGSAMDTVTAHVNWAKNAGSSGFHGSPAFVAQISNLLYRRFSIGRPSPLRTHLVAKISERGSPSRSNIPPPLFFGTLQRVLELGTSLRPREPRSVLVAASPRYVTNQVTCAQCPGCSGRSGDAFSKVRGDRARAYPLRSSAAAERRGGRTPRRRLGR